MVSHRGSAIVLLDRALAISYRLSIVTMSPPAAVWPQFFNAKFQALSSRISETVRDNAKLPMNH